MAHGSDKSRFVDMDYGGKRYIYIFIDTYTAYSVARILFVCCRAVEDKNIGPLVKTIMTRCIHCTRCIR